MSLLARSLSRSSAVIVFSRLSLPRSGLPQEQGQRPPLGPVIVRGSPELLLDSGQGARLASGFDSLEHVGASKQRLIHLQRTVSSSPNACWETTQSDTFGCVWVPASCRGGTLCAWACGAQCGALRTESHPGSAPARVSGLGHFRFPSPRKRSFLT